jgi:hypothetical protein
MNRSAIAAAAPMTRHTERRSSDGRTTFSQRSRAAETAAIVPPRVASTRSASNGA